MANEELANLVALRAARELSQELWPDGPSFEAVLHNFVRANVDATHLESWKPLGSVKTQKVVAFYFQGAALKLADRLLVHERIAMSALAMLSPALYPGKQQAEAFDLIFGLSTPRLDGTEKSETIHMLGAQCAERWLELGLQTAPPTDAFASFIQVMEQNLVRDALNPEPSHDLATTARRGKSSV